jgi:hypothetical protein
MRFKQFLLNESKIYLGQKVGDILTAAQELNNDAPNMGARDLTRFSEKIVNQIRRIIHSNWSKEETKYLKTLQTVGVALMRSIDEKDDLTGTIAGSVAVLEKLVANLGTPINKFAVTDSPPSKENNVTSDSENQKDQSAPPPTPKTMDQTVPAGPPAGGTGQDLYSPPLGGNSGPMDAF